jgi:hypothetical protein
MPESGDLDMLGTSGSVFILIRIVISILEEEY